MSSMIRKIERKAKKRRDGPGMGQSGTPKARVILKRHPETGEMTEFHLTKGWRK